MNGLCIIIIYARAGGEDEKVLGGGGVRPDRRRHRGRQSRMTRAADESVISPHFFGRLRRFANGPDRVTDTPLRVIAYHEYSWVRRRACVVFRRGRDRVTQIGIMRQRRGLTVSPAEPRSW